MPIYWPRVWGRLAMEPMKLFSNGLQQRKGWAAWSHGQLLKGFTAGWDRRRGSAERGRESRGGPCA